MERQLARYGYWIGLLCVALSVVWRIGMALNLVHERLGLVLYSSFWKVGAIFLLISVASVQYAWLQQGRAEKPAEKGKIVQVA